MESLIVFNVITGQVSNCATVETEEIKNTWLEYLLENNFINGDIIVTIEGDWRDYSNNELSTMCNKSIFSMCKSRLGDD